MKFVNKLQGKRVLVFGATSGIGFAVTEAVLEFGANVVISGSNKERLDKTVQRLVEGYPEIGDAKTRISTVVCDLSDETGLDTNIDRALNEATNGGKDKLDHITCSAGTLSKVPLVTECSVEDIHKLLVLRVEAPIMMAKHMKKYMNESADSSFTLTTGVMIKKPAPGWSLRMVSGGSLEGLSRGLAVDLAPIRVNVVEPGAIDTELLAAVPAETKEIWKSKSLVKRLGRPEDTAEAYLYCMKDGFVTGSCIQTNGGYLLL